MNRLFVIFIAFILFPLSATSQESLFEKALKKGPQPNGYYFLNNDGNKYLEREKMERYAADNGYIIKNVTYKDVMVFGEYKSSVATVLFLPKNAYSSYIYHHISSDVKLPMPPVYCYAYIYSSDSSPLQLIRGLNWSGMVNDGKAQGYGVFAAPFYDQYILFVRGNFNNGFPVGDLRITKYITNGRYDNFTNTNLKNDLFVNFGELHDNMAYIKVDGKYGFVNQYGNIVIKPEYDGVVSEFQDGKAVVVKNDEEIIITNGGKFVDYSEKQKNIFASEANLNKVADLIGREPEKALDLLNKANKYGNTKAVFWLGKLYAERRDGKKDLYEAVRWYKSAAENGNTDALYELGKIYSNNYWNGHDDNIAYDYFKRAAERGHRQAKNEMESINQRRAVFSFDMYDVDYNTDYTITIDTYANTLQATKNGISVFYENYHVCKVDESRGRIGFSTDLTKPVDMEAVTDSYFIVSRDGIIVVKRSNGEEYPMKAKNSSAFVKSFDLMAKKLR